MSKDRFRTVKGRRNGPKVVREEVAIQADPGVCAGIPGSLPLPDHSSLTDRNGKSPVSPLSDAFRPFLL